MIVLPMVIFLVLGFVFQSSIAEIQVQQLRMNCPYPVNAGVVTGTNILSNNVTVTYNILYDNDTSLYHVTIFRCGVNNGINADTTVYTADTANAWFAMTNRASGFMFYISESVTAFFQKVDAFGHMAYLFLQAPAIVTGLQWFTYFNIFLLAIFGIGVALAVRG